MSLKSEDAEPEFYLENTQNRKYKTKKSRENPGLILITKSILHYFT
ncbi:hypothetical protein J2783_000545 [Chryseobacterium sediminis]|nr:hypothetical protein [Chryseobacterium sediminis]